LTVFACVIRIALVPLEANSPKFFGFSDFLAGLALMVLVWTIADIRYKFRIRCAPLPLPEVTFAIVTGIGFLTLLTDLWRAETWLVPKVSFCTPALWQAMLAGLYLMTFLMWVVFAFLKPATFTRWNARRYARSLFQVIVKGSPADLTVIADEVTRSAKALVIRASDRSRSPHAQPTTSEELSDVSLAANQILLLIADKRFCRVVVDSSPATAWAFFSEMAEVKKFGIPIQTFACNIVNEAIENKSSFLYHESAGYESGLLGHYRPISKALFSNYTMVETIGTVLDANYENRRKWDSDQWAAYCAATALTFRDYVDKAYGQHSYALYNAIREMKTAVSDLYQLNGMENSNREEDALDRLRVVVDFIIDAVKILEDKGVPLGYKKRAKRTKVFGQRDMFENIAELIHEVIWAAASVHSPKDLCWTVQYNALWSTLFNFDRLVGSAGRVVKTKAFRLMFDDVLEMNKYPNFKGARILSFCLNVMGLQRSKQDYDKDSRALHRAILFWTRKNYARLCEYDPRVAQACLVDGMTYDAANHRLAKEYLQLPGQLMPHCVYLDLEPKLGAAENTSPKTALFGRNGAVKAARRRRKPQINGMKRKAKD